MEEAGLTPMQILACTTANAAKVFAGGTSAVSSRNRDAPEPKIGVIAPGKLADLVVLNSNPLDDIQHASDIHSVVKNGVVIEPESLRLDAK